MSIYNLKVQYQREKAEKYFARLIKNKETIELKKWIPSHSDPQRRYFHALCALFAIETGYTRAESKILAKRQYDGCVYESNGNKFLRSTAELNKQEYSQLIEKFMAWASVEHSIPLPSAEDWRENEGQIQEYIKINSQYL